MSSRNARKGSLRERPVPSINPVEALRRAVGERAEEIELKHILIDQSLQVRVNGLNTKHLDSLMADLEAGKEIDEPIVLFLTPEKKRLLADGFHRVEAYKRTGRETILAVMHEGTWADARLYAENANMKHGLVIDNDDKRAILESRLERQFYENENGYLASDQQIAESLKVSRQTVATWIEEITTRKNLRVNLTIRVGKDGIERDMSKSAEANQQRAAELAERRVAEEAERKRNLPAVEKIRIVTQYLIAKYRDERAKRHTPLMDDPKRGFEWCYQVSNPASFVVDIDWERQFLHEYGAKPVNVYREFLRLADREVFTRADMDGWTDIQLEEWVREMGRRPPRQPNAATFQQTGMAQPKHPNIEVPQPKVLGRHYSSAPAAATETETHSTPTYDCPVRVGQRVKVIMTGEISYITATEWVDVEWRLLTESHPDDSLLLSDVEIVVPAEPELDTNSAPCPFKVGDRVILKRNPASANTVKSVRQLKDGTWQLTMTTAEGYEFYEVPSNLDFAPVESAVVVVEDPAVVPFRTGDIVRDIQSGELVEVIGFSSDGSITVESDDEDDEPYRYDGWAEDFEKYDTRADPPLKAVKSDGNRQAEIMIEDARTIIPRLLLESINATVDYRMTTLVRWESQKDMQTILENADDKELRRLLREAEHAITEFTTAQKGIQTAVNRCQDMVRQIQAVRQSA